MDLGDSDRSELEDNDKLLFEKIGKTEIILDKALTQILMTQEYTVTRDIIYSDNDDDSFNVDDSESLASSQQQFSNSDMP